MIGHYSCDVQQHRKRQLHVHTSTWTLTQTEAGATAADAARDTPLFITPVRAGHTHPMLRKICYLWKYIITVTYKFRWVKSWFKDWIIMELKGRAATWQIKSLPSAKVRRRTWILTYNRPIYYFTYLRRRMTSSAENDVIHWQKRYKVTCEYIHVKQTHYESKTN